MAITVNTNMAALNGINNLGRNQKSLSKTMSRLSSGMRINSAGDDAAGLAVAENLDAADRSLKVAQRNANDGISLIQTAEGATNEVGNIVKRMRELAVQSASDTLANDERAYIQDEYVQLAGEVDRIAGVTEFNGVQLADGTNATLDVQVGINNTANDRIAITLGDVSGATLGVDTGSLDLSTAAGARTALTAMDTAIDTLNGYRSDYGSVQNRLDTASANLTTYSENVTGAESRIRDADFAQEAAALAKFQVLNQAGTAILGQANQVNSGATRLIG
ncbi:MAG: flagellin [Myxococcota bacterium]|jgi:flagellin